MATINVGVLGTGRMGRLYIEHLARNLQGARLRSIYSYTAARAEEVAAPFEGVRPYSDYHELLADPELQAVIVATPTSSHHDIVIAAAEAGKAIFCEKPLALTLPETDAMIRAIERAAVPCHVAFNRRFDRGYMAARRKIEEGLIGRPVTFRSIGRDPYRTSLEYAARDKSGGILVDFAIHDFDLARWLVGDEVERVYAEAGVLVYPELAEVGDVDNAMVSLRFSGGALGNVEVSRNARYGYDIYTEILGSEGALRVGYLQETPLLLLTREGVNHDVVPHFPERFGPAYTAQVEHFVDCVQRERTPAVSPADARAALRISLAATRSQDEGRPVAVAEIG